MPATPGQWAVAPGSGVWLLEAAVSPPGLLDLIALCPAKKHVLEAGQGHLGPCPGTCTPRAEVGRSEPISGGSALAQASCPGMSDSPPLGQGPPRTWGCSCP